MKCCAGLSHTLTVTSQKKMLPAKQKKKHGQKKKKKLPEDSLMAGMQLAFTRRERANELFHNSIRAWKGDDCLD